jgi:hypothetical protein
VNTPIYRASKLQEREEGSTEIDWLEILDKGTLTEILRRYLGSLRRSRPELVSQTVSTAMGESSFKPSYEAKKIAKGKFLQTAIHIIQRVSVICNK